MDNDPAMEVFFKSDIANTIKSVNQAAEAVANRDGQDNSDFMRGWHAALGAVAVAFGITPGEDVR